MLQYILVHRKWLGTTGISLHLAKSLKRASVMNLLPLAFLSIEMPVLKMLLWTAHVGIASSEMMVGILWKEIMSCEKINPNKYPVCWCLNIPVLWNTNLSLPKSVWAESRTILPLSQSSFVERAGAMEIRSFIPLLHVWKTREEGKQKLMEDKH